MANNQQNSIMKDLKQKVLILAAVALGLTTACGEKEKDEEVSNDFSTETDYNTAQSDFNAVLRDVDEAFDATDGDNSSSQKNAGCTVSSYSTLELYADSTGEYPHKLTIDYEQANCQFFEVKEGKLEVFFVGSRAKGDLKDSIAFTGYSVDGRMITGYKKVEQTSATEDTWVFDVYTNAVITFEDGSEISYESNRTRTRTGISTRWDVSDDAWSIDEMTTGINRNGDEIEIYTSEPMLYDAACLEESRRFPVGGVRTARNVTNDYERTLDFGEGECDREVIITTINGATFSLTLS